MFPRTQNRKAISTVLTTLIILVASVVLGTGVVLYGTSLFQTGAQSQAITTIGTTVWVDSSNSTGWAWGADGVRNNGDKLLSIDSIQVRGQNIPFSNWYADTNATRVTNSNFQSAMVYTNLPQGQPYETNGGLTNGTNFNAAWIAPTGCTPGSGTLIIQLTTSGRVLCLTQQTGPVSLTPGQKAIIYFKVPQNILTSVDAGSSASVAMYAGKVGSPVTVTVIAK